MSKNGPDRTERSDPEEPAGLDQVRKKLRDLYATIETEPLPPDLEALAKRLDRELGLKPPDASRSNED